MTEKNSHQKYILMVEDDESIREVLAMFLESNGYKVDQAENGKIALDWLRTTPVQPDLIMLDLMMPVMDGCSFKIEQEKDARLSSIPVLVMTALSGGFEKTKNMSIQGLVKKPFEIKEVMNAIEKSI